MEHLRPSGALVFSQTALHTTHAPRLVVSPPKKQRIDVFLRDGLRDTSVETSILGEKPRFPEKFKLNQLMWAISPSQSRHAISAMTMPGHDRMMTYDDVLL